MSFICRVCKANKGINDFYNNTRYKSGKDTICKKCSRDLSKSVRNKNKEYYKRTDEHRRKHDINYIFIRRYSSLKQRYTKGYLAGRDDSSLITRAEFMEWCYSKENLNDFMRIYKKYASSGFSNKEMPTIDRIDNLKGYRLDNIRWLGRSDNISLGSTAASKKALRDHIAKRKNSLLQG